MFIPAALIRDFSAALNHAVPRAPFSGPVPFPVIFPVPRVSFPVPARALPCSVPCSARLLEMAKALTVRDNHPKNAHRGATKIFIFPVIGGVTGKARGSARDHDSFVTRPSGCRHRANRIAKRLLRRGCFAAI